MGADARPPAAADSPAANPAANPAATANPATATISAAAGPVIAASAAPALIVGEPVPWFIAPCNGKPRFRFDTLAGRPLVMVFVAAGGAETLVDRLAPLAPLAAATASAGALLVAVVGGGVVDVQGGWRERVPFVTHVFADADHGLFARFGVPVPPLPAGEGAAMAGVLVVDRALRLVARLAVTDLAAAVRVAMATVQAVSVADQQPIAQHAPVLVVPRIFEPALCRRLIAYYDEVGGRPSGFMVNDENRRTIEMHDPAFKRRRDVLIADEALRQTVRGRLARRLAPMLKHAYNFEATRVERDLIACYEAEEAGHFGPHRDNTTAGTAHRRFAVTINLNAEDYEGGDLVFAEFGAQTYRAPTGGAVVFGCSMLHQVLPVTKGRRYCFLPFLYDDAAAEVRARNLHQLGDPALRDRVARQLGSVADPASEAGPGTSA